MSADLVINPAIGGDDTAADSPAGETRPALPRGIYYADAALPDDRAELFRVADRVYTVPKKVDPRVAFRQMRRLRQGVSEEKAIADSLYDVLGDAVMDFLADEELTEEQYEAVGDAISKYMMGAAKLAGLGKSQNGPQR